VAFWPGLLVQTLGIWIALDDAVQHIAQRWSPSYVSLWHRWYWSWLTSLEAVAYRRGWTRLLAIVRRMKSI